MTVRDVMDVILVSWAFVTVCILVVYLRVNRVSTDAQADTVEKCQKERKLTWLDDNGDFHIEVEDIPEAIQKLGYIEHYSKEDKK